jgi:hypothetical protein
MSISDAMAVRRLALSDANGPTRWRRAGPGWRRGDLSHEPIDRARRTTSASCPILQAAISGDHGRAQASCVRLRPEHIDEQVICASRARMMELDALRSSLAAWFTRGRMTVKRDDDVEMRGSPPSEPRQKPRHAALIAASPNIVQQVVAVDEQDVKIGEISSAHRWWACLDGTISKCSFLSISTVSSIGEPRPSPGCPSY